MGRHGLLRLTGGVLAAAFFAALGFSVAGWAAPHLPRLADTRPNAIPVDVELVLAVDVSYSMDPDEQALQREGYRLALTSKEFLQALHEGAHGKIAITYIEWAGQHDQQVVMPWRLIDGPEAADAVAAEIGRAPYRRASRTSISGGLQFRQGAVRQQRLSRPAPGDRRIRRRPQQQRRCRWRPMRDEIVAKGITINGLPLMLKRPYRGMMDIDHLDWYYEDCVIGGPGSFVIPVRDREQFVEATRNKLVLEVAGRMPKARQVMPRLGKGAAHLLHDRRDAVAAALGRHDFQ